MRHELNEDATIQDWYRHPVLFVNGLVPVILQQCHVRPRLSR